MKRQGATHHHTNGSSGQAALIFKSPWGWAGLAASSHGIASVVLPQPSRAQVERALSSAGGGTAGPLTAGQRALLRQARTQLLEFLAGDRRRLDLQADLSTGSPFQRRVWKAASRIPYGRVRSYRWVAEKVGRASHARAVGLALGANPVPILIPCHRVVAQDGSLGGFSCGLQNKRRLLTLEGTLSQLKS